MVGLLNKSLKDLLKLRSNFWVHCEVNDLGLSKCKFVGHAVHFVDFVAMVTPWPPELSASVILIYLLGVPIYLLPTSIYNNIYIS